jgi:hypothetical protein
MTSLDCFAIWAPENALWTEWAKPVAFTGAMMLAPGEPPLEVPTIEIPGLPPGASQIAVIVDLPGDEAIGIGLMLAARGFRPVPLFNGTMGPNPVIDVRPIAHALGAGAPILSRTPLAPDARPAFLLDSRRGEMLGASDPGRYDNRWIVLPQDFPSAAFLANKGIREVILIQRQILTPAEDLSHVLLRWQNAGIRLKIIDLTTGDVSEDVKLWKPSKFRMAWYVAVALLGLRRSNVGGFGSTVPEQTGRSGFG